MTWKEKQMSNKSQDNAMNAIRQTKDSETKHRTTKDLRPKHVADAVKRPVIQDGPKAKSVSQDILQAAPKKALRVNEKAFHMIEMSPTRKAADKARNIGRDKTKADLDRQIAMLTAHAKELLKECAACVKENRFDDAMRKASKAVQNRSILELRLDAKKRLDEMEPLPMRDPILRKSRSFKKVKQYKRWSDNPKGSK